MENRGVKLMYMRKVNAYMRDLYIKVNADCRFWSLEQVFTVYIIWTF